MNGKIGLRIVSALVLIAAIAGIGFFAYRAGVAQGSTITIEDPMGESAPAPYPYKGNGYGMPFHRSQFSYGCFGILITLFFFVLVMKAFRLMVWGPHWGWGHHRGPWGRHWEGGVPPLFDEWHKRAHEGPVGGGETSEDKKE